MLDEARLNAVVADRRWHAEQLQRLTGLQVGEGQAVLLLNDLRTHGVRLRTADLPDTSVARSWLRSVYEPALEALVTGSAPSGSAAQMAVAESAPSSETDPAGADD